MCVFWGTTARLHLYAIDPKRKVEPYLCVFSTGANPHQPVDFQIIAMSL